MNLGPGAESLSIRCKIAQSNKSIKRVSGELLDGSIEGHGTYIEGRRRGRSLTISSLFYRFFEVVSGVLVVVPDASVAQRAQVRPSAPSFSFLLN